MTRAQLIQYKLETIQREGAKNNMIPIVAFIGELLDNPRVTLGNIRTAYLAELGEKQQAQTAYQQKLDADVLSLQSLNVNDIS